MTSFLLMHPTKHYVCNTGQHYIVRNPITGTGGSPKWDFSSQGTYAGNADAFVIAAPAAGIPASTGAQNVPWIALNNIQGSLADQIYRVDTKGGQPPSTVSGLRFSLSSLLI